MPTRRQFVQQSAAAVVAGTLPAEAAPAAQTLNYGYIHHVFFWLKNPDNAAEKAQLLQALKDLGKIPVVKAVHLGTAYKTTFDAAVTEDSYSFSACLFFDNAEDEKTYFYHPAHKAFGEKNHHLWKKVVVYDSLKA